MFFGREDLLEQLSSLWNKRVSSLVTCRGRRRIGKSTLIEQFASRSKARFLKIEGVRPERKTTSYDELVAFAKQLSDQCGCERTPPLDWGDAFRRLDREIRSEQKTVVLLDEVSWLAHLADSFPSDLKIAWDNLLKKHDRLILVLCGSVSSWIRDRRYRIRDNYTRFYLKCIEPVKDVIDDGSFAFVSLDQFDGWNVDMGLAFENLIVNNYRELLPYLHLDRVLIMSASPYCRPPAPKTGGEGVQVDLLLQTRQSVCVVEIKRRRHIGREVVAEMAEKCRRIARPNDMSLKTALVYDGELAPSVEADGYFDAIVPAERLLGR
ncbi:MAG: ATP-binding protein [Kiritimatiellae bacterium]|nr:ATP-binding protein [Kiritimatiellia bacterium]